MSSGNVWPFCTGPKVLKTSSHKWFNCLDLLYWVAAPHQVLRLLNNMEARSFGIIFLVSNVIDYSEWIWCINTLITYHMYQHWHDRAWRHHLSRKMTPINIFAAICSLCYHLLQRYPASIVDLKGGTILWNVVLISVNASFRKIVQLKACLWIFPHSYFIKISYHMWCINWWKYYVCAPCTENAPQVWIFTSIARSTHDHVLLNFVGSVHDEEWWIGFEENILNQSDYKNIKCGW